MTKIAIIFHGGYDHTAKQAEVTAQFLKGRE